MRLIQRNLFPRRPPSAKCDGPSILKTSSSSSSSSSSNNPKPSSSVALKALLLQKTQPTTSSSANNSNTLPPSTVNSSAQQPPPPPQALSANLNSSKLPQPHPPPPLSYRHLDRSGSSHPLSKSASLSSLLQPRSARKKGGIVQGSQDSFHVSDSSSPSLSLSSSSGSLSGGRAVPPSLPLHLGAIGAHPPPGAISRRSIVSRAVVDDDDHDDIDNDDDGAQFSSGQAGLNTGDQHQDCWTDVEKLVADHVGEILSKWDQIDDEIWAKVVVMERNRRVAKAYARTPVLTIAGGGGSSTNKSSSSPSTNLVGFNGHRVTLGAFANAHRDRSVRAAIRAAGDGLLVRMDEEGNLLGKRSSERSEVSLLQNSDLKQQQKPAKISAKASVLLFDMAAFRSALEKEVLGGGKGVRRSLQTSSPSTLEKVRAALQAQCFVFLGFGNGFSANSSSNSSSLLRTPVWAILVNLVALEMLFSSLPSPLFHHLPHQTTENFYSLPAMTSGNSKDNFPNKQKQQQKPLQKSKQSPQQQQQKMSFVNASFSSSFSSSSIPPKLPPRDLQHAKPPLTLPEPDYDEEEEEEDFSHQRSVDDMADLLLSKNSKNKNNFHSSTQGLAKKPQQQQLYNDEDLYFLGYSAHVSPKFSPNVNSTLSSTSNSGNTSTSTTSRSAKNPPIVRKKFWSQSGNSGSGSGSGSSHWKFFGGSAKSSQTPQNGRQIQTLDYRTTGNTSSYNSSSSSNQRPSSAYYYSTSASQLLLPPYSYNNNSVYNSSSGYTDNNNSIYGVNTSLLRRTMQYQQLYQQQQFQQQQQQAMSRSVSSPNLRNIFFSRGGGGKKGAPHQKDFNNNNSRLF